jgi:hypothetical protein
MRHVATLVLALGLVGIGAGAFVYMLHAHSGTRWMFTAAGLVFLTGMMTLYDEWHDEVTPCE